MDATIGEAEVVSVQHHKTTTTTTTTTIRNNDASGEDEPTPDGEDQFAITLGSVSPERARKRLLASQGAAAAPAAVTRASAELGVLTSQVSQEELVRIVQDEAMKLPDLSLVLSGMSGRFPKCNSINEYEENLRAGRDMINDNDESRFTCNLWGLPPRAGRLKNLSNFDYEFFGYTQEEANYLDFQLRILYEVVYESILDAGLNPANLRGSNTGVYFGLHCNEFENAMADDPAFKPMGYYAQFAVKVAQYFDFRGVTLTFDAACASGFVGLHNAVEALKEGIIERAIVCSSNIPIHPTGSFIFYQMQMLSPTGYSRFLDSRADGYVKSEACVSCVLERKQVARRNYASFMGTMTSVDGYKPEGITFPSWESQERLIRATKELAGIRSNHIEYLEAHGTGTPAGDPQEARAISSVYFPRVAEPKKQEVALFGWNERQDERTIGPLLVGSVKTSMGHSEAASGLCALVKVALMLEHELIYANLHFAQPNTNIEALMDGRLKFVDRQQKLNAKIIPMSCYGFGGSNVHVICRANQREAIEASKQQLYSTGGDCSGGGGGGRLPRLVLMFGRSRAHLDEFFTQLVGRATHNTRHCLSDDFLALLDSLSSDKIDRLMNYRGFVLLRPSGGGGRAWPSAGPIEVGPPRLALCELAPLAESLTSPLVQGDRGRPIHAQEVVPRPCHLAFGPAVMLGGHHSGAMPELEHLKPFWATIKRLNKFLNAHLLTNGQLCRPDNLMELFRNGSGEDRGKWLRDSFVAQIAYQVAMVNLLRDTLQVKHLGTMIGHSLGEIVCAYGAGVLDEREAILVAHELGQTLDELKHLIGAGKMVHLAGVPREQVVHQVSAAQAHLSTLRVSCINGPDSVIISASHEDMDKFVASSKQMEALRSLQIEVHQVNGEFALHNEVLMCRYPEIKQRLLAALEGVLVKPMYDRTHANWISSFARKEEPLARSASAEYFVAMLCRPIDFNATLDQLSGDSIVYELGPGNVLESQIVQILTESCNQEQNEPDNNVRRESSCVTIASPSTAIIQQPKRKRMKKFHYVCACPGASSSHDQIVQLISSLGELYLAGATFNLTNLYESQTSLRQEWPVRRQTPSISSLVRWEHSAELFVPRYPLQFSKSSAKCEMPIDLVQERDKYLADHCIEGRILHPATGYLFLIWRIFSFTKRKIYDACFQDIERELMPVEFRSVRLNRAIIHSGGRQAQLYAHYEEATGRFEVKEGGSVVVEGYAHTPTENAHGLLYDDVRERLSTKRAEIEQMSKEDVYKQFRVSGYDYGPNFQCIESCSFDGQACRVKFNGHFICLTDSILQSIFLAVSQFAPSGGLFLPTRFDYVRFQPEIILAKLRESNMPFDESDGSLNTKAKREMMNKIMQRESDAGKAAPVAWEDNQQQVATENEKQTQDEEKEKQVENQRECIFETYCDPVTGIIITDGIEMRGIRATPAPRRLDVNEVLLESYQFVRDIEDPVQDERLTNYHERVEPYARCCNSMSLELIESLSGKKLAVDDDDDDLEAKIMSKEQVELYKREQLACLYDRKLDCTIVENSKRRDVAANKPKGSETYDIKKNGPKTLMSVLDQLLTLASSETTGDARVAPTPPAPPPPPPPNNELGPRQEEVKSKLATLKARIKESRVHLVRDLLQAAYLGERYVRPLVETVIENACAKRSKLRMIEINLGDGILRQQLQQLIGQIEPQLSVDYTLAHPDPNRLHGSQMGPGGSAKVAPTTTTEAAGASGAQQEQKQKQQHQHQQQHNKVHTLKPGDVASLFQDHQLRNLDLIVYKDSSCYEAPSGGETTHFAKETLAALAQSLRDGGYCLVMMRRALTLAERVVLALDGANSEADLVASLKTAHLRAMNERLARRYRSLLEHELITSGSEHRRNETSENGAKQGGAHAAAERRQLLLVANKSEPSGCCSLLLRLVVTGGGAPAVREQQVIAPPVAWVDEKRSDRESAEREAGNANKRSLPPLLLRVRHDLFDEKNRRLEWLDELKANFAPESGNSKPKESEQELPGRESEQISKQQGEDKEEEEEEERKKKEEEPRQVWLCAVATRQNPISGLIGMMQALRKELGSNHLRCFYDMHTFARVNEADVNVARIEASDAFILAARRDHLWNCVDADGNFGSFRHFTINDYLSHDECACAHQKELVVAAATTPGRALDTHDDSIRGAYVNTSTRGDLSSFAWFEAPLRYLGDKERSEQLVRVAYSALNFRDVMLATGRLPLDAISPRLAMSDCLLGLEFSGYNARGARVMGMVSGRGIATHVLCPRDASIAIEVPEWLSLREAATIPVVYATAVMALCLRGRAKRGESVLIHAGSGGVGQAAIRLAFHLGLEIYTTVGSDEKRQFLIKEFAPLGLSETNILNSRTCDFEHQLLQMTRGRGVDLVLNSLADDKLQASVNCLAECGRFLEIGKYDMSVNARLEMHKLNTNKTFHGILLDKLFDVDEMNDPFRRQLDQVMDILETGMREGFVKPIEHRVFSAHQVEEAFRFMATGKHIGKVLIKIGACHHGEAHASGRASSPLSGQQQLLGAGATVNVKAVPRFQLSPDKSFIITGGLGGFGLELCKWLVNQGARHLVITSRQGIRTGYQRAVLRRLKINFNAKHTIVTEAEADASTRDGARRLCEIARSSGGGCSKRQLGGVFHLAMVLRDTLLENMTRDDFELVCRPKVDACAWLDEATRHNASEEKLDYFVCFSSITSGKGNAGQANYAYANSYLERVCELRRAHNHHGLAIQWGAIGDVGVAFENLGGNDVIIGGTIPQRMPSCLATLGKLLCSPFATCLSVLPVNRSQEGAGDRGDLVGAIMHVLGIKDASKVSEDATLGELGLDSLMAVEIRQYIEREYDMTLNIQEIRALTIARIREIQDTEKPAGAAKAKKCETNESRRQVLSYGRQRAEAGSGTSDGGATQRPEKKLSDKNSYHKEAETARLDKSMVSSFVPAMELPHEDYSRLNHKAPHRSPRLDLPGRRKRDEQEDTERPLFFLPPIHGQFDKLEPVCANIRRPCFGLNWTRKLGKVASVHEAVGMYLQLLESADWELEFDLPAASNQQQQQQQLQHDYCLPGRAKRNATSLLEAREQTVDLVGYSFGATIAFELMVAIERRQAMHRNWLERRMSQGSQRPPELVDLETALVRGSSFRGSGRVNGDTHRLRNILRPGRLILLDGSPRQIELGSQYLARLTSKQHQLKVVEKVDELLMVFVVANVRARQQQTEQQQQQKQVAGGAGRTTSVTNGSGASKSRSNSGSGSAIGAAAAADQFLSLQRELALCSALEAKLELAARKLLELLRTACNETMLPGPARMPTVESLAHAMEAFLRRYELICSYKAKSKSLRMDCALIRADRMYLAKSGAVESGLAGQPQQSHKFNEDLELSSMTRGHVELHVMPGDHESFLVENRRQIGELVTRLASSQAHSSSSSSLYTSSDAGSSEAEAEAEDEDADQLKALEANESRSASGLSSAGSGHPSSSESGVEGEQVAASVTVNGQIVGVADEIGTPELGA